MYFIDSKMIHQDERGFIYSVIHSGEWREVNYVESQKGTVRGDHYHKKTIECFFLLKGTIDVFIKNLKNDKSEKFTVRARSVFIVDPYEVHKFQVLEDSAWINILSVPIDDKDKDIFRL